MGVPVPIYEYRCDKGHTFEVMQRMADPAVTECEVCGASVHRVFHPVAVHFKGSGFYNTDYGTKKRQRETAAAADGSSSDGGSKGDSGSSSGSGSESSDGGGSSEKKEKKDKKDAPAAAATPAGASAAKK
jgi:putative FmdB family regulatory protein